LLALIKGFAEVKVPVIRAIRKDGCFEWVRSSIEDGVEIGGYEADSEESLLRVSEDEF